MSPHHHAEVDLRLANHPKADHRSQHLANDHLLGSTRMIMKTNLMITKTVDHHVPANEAVVAVTVEGVPVVPQDEGGEGLLDATIG